MRGEVKSDAAGHDPNIYDTSVQINPQGIDTSLPISVTKAGKTIFQMDVGTTDSVVTLIQGAGNFFWEHTDGDLRMA